MNFDFRPERELSWWVLFAGLIPAFTQEREAAAPADLFRACAGACTFFF